MPIVSPEAHTKIKCHHCGDDCINELINYDEHQFCCQGCRAVYELFQDSDLTSFYNSRLEVSEGAYDYLSSDEIANEFILLKTSNYHKIILNLPAIHCSACIYVLENLAGAQIGINRVTINFTRKTAEILFEPDVIDLPRLCRLLAAMGYPPDLSRKRDDQKTSKSSLPLQIGIAGFCFGNIMLLSFPEYLGIDMKADLPFTQFFGYISILLSLPILLYAGAHYFLSAYKGLKQRFVNIDVPIALGMLVLFIRSSYEIIFHLGAGYLDSLAGLVFFLLIGRWFQSKTYENLSFERDYNSYFPLSVLREGKSGQENIPINKLNIGDRIMIRNNEVIPADAILLSDNASIDYSFVTGEEVPIQVNAGEMIYAGGRLIGQRISLEIIHKSSQSYLTNLWNNQVFKGEKHAVSEELTNKISKHFTMVIIGIASLAAIYWSINDASLVWQVVSAILIVACPCALALSAPFTNGNTIRILGRNGFFLKKAAVAERIPDIDTIIFDKTGTITNQKSNIVAFIGSELSSTEAGVVKSMTMNSTHPLSKIICKNLVVDETDLAQYEELSGKGLQASDELNNYQLGSANWLNIKQEADEIAETRIYFKKNKKCLGYFAVSHNYRPGLRELVNEVSEGRNLMVLSGDNDGERENLQNIFPAGTSFIFDQKPEDKLNVISELQRQGRRVMMIGDGLNDAGALKQSEIGIAITDDVGMFSPACDGILEGGKLQQLNNFLDFTRRSKYIIYLSFGLSFLYNIGGITVAFLGIMTPIFAAILMPLSSISVVLFTTLGGNYLAKKLNL